MGISSASLRAGSVPVGLTLHQRSWDEFLKIYRTLADHGRFVFSVEHPVITSCDRSWQGVGNHQDWLVENYFVSLQRSGFLLESLREAEPQPEQVGKDHETYQRRKRIPLFLIMAGRKSA